jgi:hypothetical protein
VALVGLAEHNGASKLGVVASYASDAEHMHDVQALGAEESQIRRHVKL